MTSDTDDDGSTPSSVQVAVRVRPFLPLELGSDRCIDVLPPDGSNGANAPKALRIGGQSGPTFAFDHVLPPSTTQPFVYSSCVRPLVNACLDGYNATVLAYGQTGSGKTFTILGSGVGVGVGKSEAVKDEAGVLPRALRELFASLEEKAAGEEDKAFGFEWEVRVLYLELYGEEIRDLLGGTAADHILESQGDVAVSGGGDGHHGKGLTIRDYGENSEPEVVGATEITVRNTQEALGCLRRGNLRRVTGATAMNEESSRSHAIMTVVVEQRRWHLDAAAPEDSDGALPSSPTEVEARRSKFHFVDLAGSERLKRTEATGQRRKEGIDINKGLLVLGNVISALGDPKKKNSFVPYRDSKLTRMLKGSLGGNHKTLMIACVSPSSSNLEESLNCLRYANRAKNIQNHAVVNVDAGSRMIAELRSQVKELATELLWYMEDKENADDNNDRTNRFTVDILKAMCSGGDPPPKTSSSRAPSASSHPPNDTLSKARLDRAKKDLDDVTEALHMANAEKEFYRMQATALERRHDPNAYLEKPISTNSDDEANISKQEFMTHMAAMERQLADYRCRLRQLQNENESKTNGQNTVVLEQMLRDDSRASQEAAILRAQSAIEAERSKLTSLQRALSPKRDKPSSLQKALHNGPEARPGSRPGSRRQGNRPNSNGDNRTIEEGCGHSFEDDTAKLTQKYLRDHSDEDMDSVQADIESAHNSQEESSEGGGSGDVIVEGYKIWQDDMDAHLMELSKSIAAKEDLIEQLRLGQERYEAMKEFYSNKLADMEAQLNEREMERHNLAEELERSAKNSKNYSSVKAALDAKERQILELRKKHLELKKLTNVSSRNEDNILRLRNDISTMKRQKVELQKQMAIDKKANVAQIRQLKKDAMRQEREASKWKKMSERSKAKADAAERVAKLRSEEIGRLRTKYRDAEKALRIRTLKRGVMERAGLDPLMVGRRDKRRPTNSPHRTSPHSRRVLGDATIEKLRDFLDRKVAEVGRKEAAADKVAHEWEDHLELMARKNELTTDSDTDQEQIESLNVQIKYKEERIRDLTRHLRSTQTSPSLTGMVPTKSVLDEKEFKALCSGVTQLHAATVASKVLFGMVVKERRRVAALARTASTLDQKACDAEELAASKDASLKAYIDETNQERAELIRSQDEQILSLMSLVRDEEEQRISFRDLDLDVACTRSPKKGDLDAAEDKNQPASDMDVQEDEANKRVVSAESMMSILANERVALLEGQVADLKRECDSLEEHRRRADGLKVMMKEREKERDDLHLVVDRLQTALHQVQSCISSKASDNDSTESVKELMKAADDIVKEALAHSASDLEKLEGSKQGKREKKGTLSHLPSLEEKKRSELMFDMESEIEEDMPEWAGDIMADLALIAEGKMPPALKRSHRAKQGRRRGHFSPPGSMYDSERGDKSRPSSSSSARSVFERLQSPSSYTGVAQQKLGEKKPRKKRSIRVEHSTASRESPTISTDQLSQITSERSFDYRDTSPPRSVASLRDVPASPRVRDYTQQDVFERLQKKVTESYAVKHKKGEEDNVSSDIEFWSRNF